VKVTPEGKETTFAGLAWDSTLAADSVPPGTLQNQLNPDCADGNAIHVRLNDPEGIAVEDSGNVYFADSLSSTIRKVTPEGAVITLAGNLGNSGSADGSGAVALFYRPVGIALDGSGNIYVADCGNSTIRKITPKGEVTTLAGSPGISGFADGKGNDARFDNPQGIAVDRHGNVFVADCGNGSIREVTPDGVVTTIGGTASVQRNPPDTDASKLWWSGLARPRPPMGRQHESSEPTGIAVTASGIVYVADVQQNEVLVGVPQIPH